MATNFSLKQLYHEIFLLKVVKLWGKAPLPPGELLVYKLEDEANGIFGGGIEKGIEPFIILTAEESITGKPLPITMPMECFQLNKFTKN